MTIPIRFVERMRELLGAEADAFLDALAQPPTNGLRVNPLKVSGESFRRLVSWPLTPLSWCDTGFAWGDDSRVGKHAYHAAGLYYLQEPSAMAVAAALQVAPGQMVLDLAAAPGGKSTQLAASLGDVGLLVANEVVASRTKALAENLERWGARRAIIMNEEPARLSAQWGAIFDRVLLDAPCSGEGMFRKSEDARRAWSEEHVRGCALRQQKIIQTAAELVKPGGLLVYSTCTFAPEENEAIIAGFLAQHDEFVLLPLSLPGAQPGRPDWLAPENRRLDLAHCACFWPHHVTGEGHFIALLQRGADAPVEIVRKKRGARTPSISKQDLSLWRAFSADTLQHDPASDAALTMFGAQLYAVPREAPHLDGLKVVRAGWWLGTIQHSRFVPSHSLALALRASDANDTLDFAPDDERLQRYLQGHPLDSVGSDGWVLMTTAGFPLGWGRRAQGVVKNFYPKGLRWMG